MLSKQRGFTLIETNIYVAIIGLTLFSFVQFAFSIVEARNKTYVAQEVQANARIAQNTITQKIRTATGINISPSTFGANPGKLSLIMSDTNKNPTIMEIVSGVLRLTEGTGSAIPITSDEVDVSNLVFTNLSQTGERGHVRVEMTVRYRNPSGDVKFEYSETMETAVSLRQ